MVGAPELDGTSGSVEPFISKLRLSFEVFLLVNILSASAIFVDPVHANFFCKFWIIYMLCQCILLQTDLIVIRQQQLCYQFGSVNLLSSLQQLHIRHQYFVAASALI